VNSQLCLLDYVAGFSSRS